MKHCPKCQQTVGAKDRYCGFCATSLEKSLNRSVALTPASWLGILASWGADALFFWVCFTIALPQQGWPVPILVAGAVVSALVYWCLLNSQGRQTFGQTIFGFSSFDTQCDRYPVPWEILTGTLTLGLRRQWKWYRLTS